MSDAPKLMGVRKVDTGKKLEFSHLILRVNNLKKGRDNVSVNLPKQSGDSLAVQINGAVIYTTRLPGDIIEKDCKHEVNFSSRGEVKVKLKKREPSSWIDSGRWSPEKDSDN